MDIRIGSPTFGQWDTVLLSNELALSVSGPALGLPIPAGIEPLMSTRDSSAPTLARGGRPAPGLRDLPSDGDDLTRDYLVH